MDIYMGLMVSDFPAGVRCLDSRPAGSESTFPGNVWFIAVECQ